MRMYIIAAAVHVIYMKTYAPIPFFRTSNQVDGIYSYFSTQTVIVPKKKEQIEFKLTAPEKSL
jgi:hypothetical protein